MNMKYKKANVEVVDFSGFVNMNTRSKDPLGHWFSENWKDCSKISVCGDYAGSVAHIICDVVTKNDGSVTRESISCPSYA